MRSCYFNQAVSIRRIPLKVPKYRIVPSTLSGLMPLKKTNRQTISFVKVTVGRTALEKTQDFPATRCGYYTSPRVFFNAAWAAARRATGTRNGEQET